MSWIGSCASGHVPAATPPSRKPGRSGRGAAACAVPHLQGDVVWGGVEAHIGQKCAAQVWFSLCLDFLLPGAITSTGGGGTSWVTTTATPALEDSWDLSFTQSFKSELKQDLAFVGLLCKLGKMWFHLLISSRMAKIFSDGWKGACFIGSHRGSGPQSAVSHSHCAEVLQIIWTRNETLLSWPPGFLSLTLIN